MNLKYDNKIAVATGRSRKETHWRNQEMLWSDFVEKLSSTHRTPETWAEYVKAEKSRQDEIKDIGGFVGGMLTGGRRKSGSVTGRSLVTLDIDNGDAFVWEDFTLLYSNAAVVYSTHKHTQDKPRLRLVIPLDRQVTPEEYVPIARNIAGLLGINRFDDTTFEPERLMYWPSTPKDVEYYFRYQDGPFISADGVLSTYRDWRDASEWPVSERQGEAIRREMKKQADPLEKPGIVGVFCRTYGIGKAIETFLPDVYEACDVDSRYTYKEGSTAAGLIVYDDKFAYSHHGTDPVSGMLCNAFDLVRVHLFGLRDEDVKTNGTRADRYPSYLAMEELALKDTEVKRTLAAEKLQSAGEDFAGIAEEEKNDWLEKLESDRKGNYLPTIENARLIIENDPNLKGCFAIDAFSDKKLLKRMPPWRRPGDENSFFIDSDEANLRNYLAREPWGIESRQKVEDALAIVMADHAFHPVREYFNSLIWDGRPRLDTLFIDYLGTDDTELNRMITRLMFVAAAYRIFEPGTKFDQITVLVGTQGCGKSTIVEKMCIKPEWFTNSMPSPDDPIKAAAHLRGKLFVEVGELAGFKKAENEAIKNFLSKTADDFRPAFGKNELHRPRQCVFFGTTNEESFLRDATGNRRYWPVKVAENAPKYNVWEDLTRDVVGQIWAEALSWYRKRHRLLLPKELEAELNSIREAYNEVDEWQGIIEEFLNKRLPANWGALGIEQRKNFFQVNDDSTYALRTILRSKICVAEILNECPYLGIRGIVTKVERNRIGAVMRNLPEWEKTKCTVNFGPYGKQKFWKRIEKEDGLQEYGNIF